MSSDKPPREHSSPFMVLRMHLAQTNSVLQKIASFCNELGAPAPGVGVAKIIDFRNT